jgi:hypothetical protein
MKVMAQSDAFNINYYDFSLQTSIIEPTVSIDDLNVYPNPFNSELNVAFNNLKSKHASIKLMDISGRISKVLYQGSIDNGINNFNFMIDSNLPGGIYFVEIQDDSQRYFKKVIKK